MTTTTVSLFIERSDEETVTLEGRVIPRRDVLRIVQVGSGDYATLTEETATRHGLWDEDI
ncbi:hypothetical protein [uncultured Bradyrhizobium sp.]|uniref:hypothetical protein n=1 Tax=uncultured Bradyrhizobium sp. TaxID=199684 RepID=UPI002621DE2F|nr:hypothetical protein [uncultured Bradyrhizobium sp.]